MFVKKRNVCQSPIFRLNVVVVQRRPDLHIRYYRLRPQKSHHNHFNMCFNENESNHVKMIVRSNIANHIKIAVSVKPHHCHFTL